MHVHETLIIPVLHVIGLKLILTRKLRTSRNESLRSWKSLKLERLGLVKVSFPA